MTSSFYNGISGIKTQQFAMDVQSNNISNINTAAYKGLTPEVSSLFSTTLTGVYASYANDKGLGAQSQTTALNLAQGVLENTDSPFDLAIQGDGWFGVKGQDTQKTYYTRAGSFSIDAQGSLVNTDGSYLMATSGNNITPTSLDATTLAKFGTYYKAQTSSPLTPYAITPMTDIALGSVGSQTKVTLPDILYYPPVATTKVSYGANLDPTIKTDAVTVPLNAADYTATVTPTALGHVSLNGTVNNTTALQNPKEGDAVTITLTDVNGNTKKISTELDASLNWSIANSDVSSLNTASALTASVSVKSTQEIANIEHFTTGIIAPDGDKDILDMTFTKRVPQEASGSTWDANVNIYSYYEDYTIEQLETQPYDSTKTYDPAIYDVYPAQGIVTQHYDPTLYDVNINTRTVTKHYDSSEYYVNTSTNKVYEIISNTKGNISFDSNGNIRSISDSLLTIDNQGTPLDLNLGLKKIDSSFSVANSNLTISGQVELGTAAYDIKENDLVNIKITNEDGSETYKSARVSEDGSWSMTIDSYSNTPSEVTSFVSVSNGYGGLISSTSIEKAHVASANGTLEGFLKDYAMDSNGNVIAEFTNGKSSAVAKVAIYHFQNDQGLIQDSATLFEASDNSGKPIFYTDKNGESFLGSTIFSSKLEGSNVSMATALTELIIVQKAFDASSKSITTSDELIKNAINMKT